MSSEIASPGDADVTPLPEDPYIAIDIWNRQNPRSVVNLLHPKIGAKLLSAQLKVPHLFGLDEKILYTRLRAEAMSPTALDNRVRMNFWNEYERAQAELRSMRTANIPAGVTDYVYFCDVYLNQASRVAWMLTPFASYMVIAEEALMFGLNQLRDILELDHVDGKGKINTKLVEIKLKVIAMLDIRVKGAPVQRIESKSLAINYDGAKAARDVASMAEQFSMEYLERKLKDLEKKEQAIFGALPAPDPTLADLETFAKKLPPPAVLSERDLDE